MLFSLLVSSLLFHRAVSRPTAACKCVPSESCWPTDEVFSALNDTLSGQLVRGQPPASVCYPDQPSYDTSACETILASWFNSTFHASDPISIGWPWWAANPCPPVYPNGTSVTGDPDAGAKGCTIGKYPAYAVNATSEKDVQEAVNFAREHNVRLNVKATGHSFQGRSTAYGSLSIWTRNLRGIAYHENFQPDACPTNSTQLAATIKAGEKVRNVYEAMAARNAVVVAGSNQEVGIMGWFTGGGHGPLSASYGLGVDNVLQAKIVTPDGELLTINPCLNSDLFWAVRGGGGSTFGVVTEVTMKAYPSPKTVRVSLSYSVLSTTSLDDGWHVLARLFADLPRLKEAGAQGYTVFGPPSPDGSTLFTYFFSLYMYDISVADAEAVFAPIRTILDPLNGTTIVYGLDFTPYPNFYDSWNGEIGPEPVGTRGLTLGSRLLPAEAFSDVDRLAALFSNLTTILPNGTPLPAFQAHLVAPSDKQVDNAVHPAWRNAVAHFIVSNGGFDDWETKEEVRNGLEDLTFNQVGALKELAPDSGAYFNEGDPFDPDWQNTFFGPNYPRLKEIKGRYDADGLLWCQACVGSEDWEELVDGRICKTRREESC